MNSVTSCSDHTKIIVSLLRDMQLNDQRATLLQLVDKFKAKWKNLGGSNEAVDLKKEEIEQLIVQLILDRVLVCVHCKYCQLIHKYILWSLISISHLTLIG